MDCTRTLSELSKRSKKQYTKLLITDWQHWTWIHNILVLSNLDNPRNIFKILWYEVYTVCWLWLFYSSTIAVMCTLGYNKCEIESISYLEYTYEIYAKSYCPEHRAVDTVLQCLHCQLDHLWKCAQGILGLLNLINIFTIQDKLW